MKMFFGVMRIRALFAAAMLLCLADVAAAQQMCPSPYYMLTSPISGRICTSNCAPGSFPTIENGAIACRPGIATAICPEGGDFMVMTPTGPACQKGYVPVPTSNNSFACKDGDVRVERPPYQLNGALTYETCAAGPSCPAGYIETVDPDNALGTSKVCVLPCQSVVMNQAMACSCGSGARLAAQQPGAPVRQVCQATCPAGTHWEASSPLFAFQAEQGQCIADGGGVAVPLAESEPLCPSATYWNGQVCLPIGGGSDGAPVLVFGGCPPGKHWNGSHCVPDVIVLPVCPPGTHWNGLFCVPNARRHALFLSGTARGVQSSSRSAANRLERLQMRAEVPVLPTAQEMDQRTMRVDPTVRTEPSLGWHQMHTKDGVLRAAQEMGQRTVRGGAAAVRTERILERHKMHAEVPVLHSAKEMDQRKVRVRRLRRPL